MIASSNRTYFLSTVYVEKNMKRYENYPEEMEKFKETALAKFDLFLLTDRITQAEYQDLGMQLGVTFPEDTISNGD